MPTSTSTGGENLKALIRESLRAEGVKDPFEAGAIALAASRSLAWSLIKEEWRKEIRLQARTCIEAADRARQGVAAKPKKERVRFDPPKKVRLRLSDD